MKLTSSPVAETVEVPKMLAEIWFVAVSVAETDDVPLMNAETAPLPVRDARTEDNPLIVAASAPVPVSDAVTEDVPLIAAETLPTPVTATTTVPRPLITEATVPNPVIPTVTDEVPVIVALIALECGLVARIAASILHQKMNVPVTAGNEPKANAVAKVRVIVRPNNPILPVTPVPSEHERFVTPVGTKLLMRKAGCRAPPVGVVKSSADVASVTVRDVEVPSP